jgi:hypothetical protein
MNSTDRLNLVNVPPSTVCAPFGFNFPRAKCIAAVKRHDQIALVFPNLSGEARVGITTSMQSCMKK